MKDVQRKIEKKWQAVETQDGAGVKLRRALGTKSTLRMDPFLMLDAFSSDDPNDYIAGFPAHPHRGFETITYIIDGHMRHRDHLGNEGMLQAGGVQWMVAGKGIIHEEMPQQENGLLRGFQIWLNLPAKDKMQPASYKDLSACEMPWQKLNAKASIKLIAGRIKDQQLIPLGDRLTAPLIADIALEKDSMVSLHVPADHSALVYVFEGDLNIGTQTLKATEAAVLSLGRTLEVKSSVGARLLLLAGQPLHEPIKQYGPFVMNTEQEIAQAIEDYRLGKLTV